jgi:hypothetical protein
MKKRMAMGLMVGLVVFSAGTVWGFTESGNNNFFGFWAGENTTGDNNSFFGTSAGYNNTTGSSNNFFGVGAGSLNTAGSQNNFVGISSGWGNTSGSENNFFGNHAGEGNTIGYENSFFGHSAGIVNTEGYSNSFFGHEAGRINNFGYNNTYLGAGAGRNIQNGHGNVFLGYMAGANEGGNDKLYISNSDISTPLIYGEFDIGNEYLEINGRLAVQGADINNSFSYKVFGHTGGNSHTQMVTDLADSRFTVMAAETADYAPRLQMTGPQDGVAAVAGWMIFDYGSGIYNLPNARFVLRHFGGSSSDYVNMIETNGRQSVSFPTGNVGIGTTSPTHLIHLAGGAYSNGPTWVNASSRELKKNIQEISAEEAVKTVENLQPVSFNYKVGDQDEHVGFIAEDVPELVATSNRKGLESMDIVAVLTKVVQEQQKTMYELLKRDKEQQAKIEDLETVLRFMKDRDLDLAKMEVFRYPEREISKF